MLGTGAKQINPALRACSKDDGAAAIEDTTATQTARRRVCNR